MACGAILLPSESYSGGSTSSLADIGSVPGRVMLDDEEDVLGCAVKKEQLLLIS